MFYVTAVCVLSLCGVFGIRYYLKTTCNGEYFLCDCYQLVYRFIEALILQYRLFVCVCMCGLQWRVSPEA
jgi:hypothetical protein